MIMVGYTIYVPALGCWYLVRLTKMLWAAGLITHMQSVLAKRRPCKNNMAPLKSKNETEVLEMIYNFKTHKTPAAYGGTGSSVP